MNHPFSLDSTFAYEKWRDEKLKNYPTHIEDLVTGIDDPGQLSAQESLSLRTTCAKTNFAIYESKQPMDTADVQTLGQQLGLVRLDHNLCADSGGISTLRVERNDEFTEYIPYSNQQLNWHTDGYYNSSDLRIRAFILHCVRPAASGGETKLLDHEIAYLLLREKNPDYIRALMHPQAMTIPANLKDNTVIRGESSGPVFSLSNSEELEVRYTARKRSIRWRNDDLLSQARNAFTEITEDPQFLFRHCLQPNQGVICNNTLHARTAFEDSSRRPRLIYRARYYDRIQGISNELSTGIKPEI